MDDTWVIGPEAGLRYFVNQTTFILGMIEWEFLLDGDDEDSAFLYTVGIGFRW